MAAGRGTRFGSTLAKQYQLLAGSPVLLHAIRPFASHPDIAHIVVVLPSADAPSPPAWLDEVAGSGGRLSIAVGGSARRDSVAAGLAALPPRVA